MLALIWWFQNIMRTVNGLKIRLLAERRYFILSLNIRQDL